MNTITTLIEQLEHQRFYGALEIKLEAGRVVLIRKTETIKPSGPKNRNNRGGENESD